MIYETRSIAHRLTVGVGHDYDALVIIDTEEVGGLVNEAEHFVDEIEGGNRAMHTMSRIGVLGCLD